MMLKLPEYKLCQQYVTEKQQQEMRHKCLWTGCCNGPINYKNWHYNDDLKQEFIALKHHLHSWTSLKPKTESNMHIYIYIYIWAMYLLYLSDSNI